MVLGRPKISLLKKILSFLKLILLLSIAGIVAFCGLRYFNNTPQTYPYPYKVADVPGEEAALAGISDILIVGDSAGKQIKPFLKDFKEQADKLIDKPLTIYNWASSGETLAQTLAKIKALQKLPLIIIYHGGLDEMDQLRFRLPELPTFLKNLELVKQGPLMSAVLTFPPLGRILFHPIKKQIIPLVKGDTQPVKGYPKDLSSTASLKVLEAIYSIYSWEAKEFFSYLRHRDARLWFVPQAYNIKVPPTKTCESATSKEIEKDLDKAQEFLLQSQFKDAFSIVNKVIRENKTHARAYYTMGNLLSKRGDFSEAKRAYYQAMIYDCGLNRSNPIFLRILMEQAEKNDFTIIDFNRQVTNSVGQNVLFRGLREPQEIYYQNLVNDLLNQFKKYLYK